MIAGASALQMQSGVHTRDPAGTEKGLQVRKRQLAECRCELLGVEAKVAVY